MNRALLSSLAVGWVSSLASWLTLAHPVLSLLATGLAAVASLYAVVVSRRTAVLRRLEIQKTVQELCEGCRAGLPVAQCPIEKGRRPKDCPHQEKET